MKQYLDLLKTIRDKGTYKPAAREGMPGTVSIFGYQFRHNLSEGFPLITTKKMFWKGVVAELLWFLRGDTNIKYLVDNGVNIWNEDAYNYYLKLVKQRWNLAEEYTYSFDDFVKKIKNGEIHKVGGKNTDYTLGDCGKQYGWLWRNWQNIEFSETSPTYPFHHPEIKQVDQIAELVKGLKANPTGRRHIITAWNPATLDDMALNACHTMVQFNCRPLKLEEKFEWAREKGIVEWEPIYQFESPDDIVPILVGTKGKFIDKLCPQYHLDCQLYQRSADVILGVPFNIASYALLTHIIAKICGMIPGEFIHTFGDVHIYDNHIEACQEQLKREPKSLPQLKINKADAFWMDFEVSQFHHLDHTDFQIENYDPYPAIKAELSTGLKHEDRSQASVR